MDKFHQDINFAPPSRMNPRTVLWIIFFIALFIIVFLMGYGFIKAWNEAKNEPPLPTVEEKPSLVRGLKRLVFSENRLLDGYDENRVNVLFLGVGGPGHDGPQLSDTIILASYRPSDKKIALLSIPRDMAVNIPGYGIRKINHANAYGEEQNPGKGGELAAQIISETLDEPIHYWIRVDFSAFTDIINTLGGIPITVDQSFVDKEYPTNNFGVQTIVFEKGMELMNGERALQFARSRHGSSGEGSDFARARRQQKMLAALKEKILTPETLANPLKLTAIFNSLITHIDTDLNLVEMIEFTKKARSLNTDTMVSHVLSIGPDQFLQEITNDYGYFLIPKAGDFSEIAQFVNTMFDATPPAPVFHKEIDVSAYREARVVILNGTWEPGLAATVQKQLSDANIAVSRIGNTPLRNYTSSIVYQTRVNDSIDVALTRMTPILNMPITREPIPFTLEDNADIVIIIGSDFIRDHLKQNNRIYGSNFSSSTAE